MHIEDENPLALLFKERRRKLWKTQAEASEAMGVWQATVSAWESGKRPVPAYAIKLLDCIEKRLALRMFLGTG